MRPDFPFDKLAATRRIATDKIQAEDYQRMSGLRTQGGARHLQHGRRFWAKYANIDFGAGITKAVFQLAADSAGAGAEPPSSAATTTP